MGMSPEELRRKKQANMRKLTLELLNDVEWEGKTQPEIVAEIRPIAYEYLLAIYDSTSTLFSRFVRTVRTTDPRNGKRVRGMWRSSDGKWYRWETLLQDPALMADCLSMRDNLTTEDVDARNRLAEEYEKHTGIPYPKTRLVYDQLPLGLFPPPNPHADPPQEA